MMTIIRCINEFLWGYPILIILMGTHLYFTIRLKFIQKKVFQGVRLSVRKEKKTKITDSSKKSFSSFSALMTTLAATIGTGNIVGMSTAVALGGPGAVFWCWMTGILGMATSYAECWLCHRYRFMQKNGSISGGPMYIFTNALHKPGLGILYGTGIVAVSFFVGCTIQSNSIALTSKSSFHISPEISGILCVLITALALIGGCQIIGRICSVLVPFMGIFYLVCCFLLLYLMRDSIGPALQLILVSAFSKESLTGGILGGGIASTLRYGIARGLFTNEAGMGSAGIAAAHASTEDSNRQALVSMTGVFWDTVVMCGITGLVIVAGFVEAPAKILGCSAGELTLAAFSRLPYGGQLLSLALILFAVSTIIGWFFLGEQAFTFLSKNEAHLMIYKCAYLILLFWGAIASIEAVWELTDFINLFLLSPNIYLLWRLRKQIPS